MKKQGLSKEKQKWILSLKLKKNRQSTKLFIVEGVKIADEIIQTVHSFVIHAIFATDEWLNAPERQIALNPHRHCITEITTQELSRISDLQSPNQVLMILEMEKDKTLLFPKDGLYLALDGLQDPGNVGTIIRIADWFGISGVFIGQGCAEVYNPKVLQASMGSFLRVQLFQDVSLPDWLGTCAQFMPIYGAVLDGRNILEMKPLARKGILVIGNESQGISTEIKRTLTDLLAIPRIGGAESLNAAVATGILCSCFFGV